MFSIVKKTMLGLFVLLFIGILLFTGIMLWQRHHENIPQTIALVPLDSRPCNTQYAQVLGDMVNINVILPPESALDDFLTPSKEAALWSWIEKHIDDSDRMIIFTNQLFNGGLIRSRSDIAYNNVNEQLTRLTELCESHPNASITIVTVLPRIKPSQYDGNLWMYEAQLTQWAADWDKALAENGPAPQPPKDVPLDITKTYLQLYNQTETMVNALAQMAADQKIDRYVIGQDDADEWSFSNIIFREMERHTSTANNITTLHGADELTMLLLANAVSQAPERVRVIYTNPQRIHEYYPFEAADLETVVNKKLSLVGLIVDDSAENVIVIHNDPKYVQYTKDLIITEKNHYVGIADVSYANKGDVALGDLIFRNQYFDRVNCYAGWNTAGNTIGTVVAHLRLQTYLADHWFWFDKNTRNRALSGLMTFKYLRLAEDQIYQGQIRPVLESQLLQQHLIDYKTTFQSNTKSSAEKLLHTLFLEKSEDLNKLMEGYHSIYLGNRLQHFSVTNCQGDVNFPWNRSFEIHANVTFQLTEETK